jgi:hypothetical protein
MAINPNTNFAAGQVLTADQANRWPRGVMQFTQRSASTANITTSETQSINNTVFTAVANRYYKITYFEPQLSYVSGTITRIELRIRLTNVAGTQLALAATGIGVERGSATVSTIQTFSAGSVTILGTLVAAGSGTPTFFGAAGSAFPAYITVEDIGPA